MKLSNTHPPNYEEICEAFGVRGRRGVVFTWGSTLYNPSGVEIAPDLWAHEAVHERQQLQHLGGPAGWWERYIASPEFRLNQEVAAYRAQYRFAEANYGRAERRRLLAHICKALAGPMYGHLVTPAGARELVLA